MKAFIHLSASVETAIRKGAPVVALESTIIAHGMPFPENRDTARRLESVIRSEGATPATIAILEGQLKVGISDSELDRLADPQQTVLKVSRRDLAACIARRQHGACTVAATMQLAAAAGIAYFATGGIGGVHRGAELSMDISADLQELSRTPVAVISAGAKAVLDIGRTLEYLETLGVPVVGYQTNEFPAFYSRSSGFPVDYRVDDPETLARIFHIQQQARLGGMLIANPIPPNQEMANQQVQRAIEQAIVESKAKGIRGKAITPFLLQRLNELTSGQALRSNIQLVLNNARLAAKIAVAHHRIGNR